MGKNSQRELITDIKRKKVDRLAAKKMYKCTKTNKEQNEAYLPYFNYVASGRCVLRRKESRFGSVSTPDDGIDECEGS